MELKKEKKKKGEGTNGSMKNASQWEYKIS